MANTQQRAAVEGANRVIESVREAEESALEAVRRFVDTVDGIFPNVSEDGLRRKIIDSAFKMTEQVVGASTQLAQKVVKATGDALTQADKPARAPSPARKPSGASTRPRKSTAASARTPARSSARRKSPAGPAK